MKKTLLWSATALCSMAMLFTSCDKDNDNESDQLPGGKGHILLEPTVKNDDGMSGSSYMLQIPGWDSKLSLDNAIQVGFAATFTVQGNDVYMFPGEMAKSGQLITRYERSEDGFRVAATKQIVPGSSPYSLIYVNSDKAYIPLYTLGRIDIVNPKTLNTIGQIDLSGYAYSDLSPEPAIGIIRGDYMYLALNQLGPDWMPFADYRQSDVAIIDIKADTVVKVISESATGLCFPTRPYLKDMIFMNEGQDIYVACAGYFGYNPQYLRNGFVCIPAGQQDFDESRSWDVSGTVIAGTPGWKASTIYNTCYIGSGKLIAFVGIPELNDSNPYTARNTIATVIDLNAKTITRIDGIPNTDGHSVCIVKHDNLFYLTAYGVNQSGVFSYNPATGAVEQVISCNSDISYLYIF
ncbi:MAG: hypothetical protein IKS24_00780 [Bacteroidaceae bacterium]|nr:hypothetical protein [Bacteroidaceae bacterium]